jgi:cyclic pyranopterin phosphate synthase
MVNDKLSRNFKYLRISVTDKCNYRCSYCMPKDIFGKDHQFLQKSELLTYEEIIEVVKVLKGYGLEKVRLTGGEPLLRKNIELLVKGLKDLALVNEVSITTNGSLLDLDKINLLKNNGLDTITISLDSLSQNITDELNPTNNNISKVMNAIDDALKIFGFLKINMVVIKNKNSHEIINMVKKFLHKNIELRFIEYMDVGESNNWGLENVLTSKEAMDIIGENYSMSKIAVKKDSTSEKWQLDGYPLSIAFISSISKPFCSNCNRGRLSADGRFYNCLFSDTGYDFTNYIRNKGLSLGDYFEKIWLSRNDQYSQLRFTKKIIKNKKNKVEMSYIGG